jgi:outer membrane protein assembly factor BamB
VRILLLTLLIVSPVAADWSQWGGPNRNFKIEASPVATSWPAAGPPRLWHRALGEGYSGIVTAGSSLYTMYRRAAQDVVIALDANTGRTLWEAPIDAPHRPGDNMTAGPGPYATPLVVGNRLFVVTVMGNFQALDRQTGKRIWSHDLLKEYGGTPVDPGYSMSPIAYGDTIIVSVGGRGHAMMAFRQSDGAVAWQKGDFTSGTSSPLLARIDGREQLVNFMAKEVAAFDPATGNVLWSHPHQTRYDLNIATPAWCEEEGVLVIASAYDGGARGLRPSASSATELWHHNRLRVHHGNMICIDGVVYGSSGDFGPAPFTAVEATSGRVLWQDRTFSKANMLHVGQMVLVLDADGTLGVTRPSREGLKVFAQTQILEQTAWTAPTLVGTRLYARDRKNIVALDLAAGHSQ